jgi:hypothetical protein
MEPAPLTVVDKMVDAMLATELDVVMWRRELVEELAIAAKKAYEMTERIVLHATIEKIEEKIIKTNWHNDGVGVSYDRTSLGWFVQFEGSTESLHLFDTKPDWQVGDKVKITFERETNG